MKKTVKIIISLVLLLTVIALSAVSAFALNLDEGTYSVNVYLWHSSKDKPSMAEDALKEEAKIVVRNGEKRMYIYTKEMTMMGITASLQELEVADSGGKLTSAKVESRDSDGNPTSFSFILTHTDEYISVKVNPHVALMANQAIGARIKVDYSSLALTSAAKTQASQKAAEAPSKTEAPKTTEAEAKTSVSAEDPSQTTSASTTVNPEETTQSTTQNQLSERPTSAETEMSAEIQPETENEESGFGKTWVIIAAAAAVIIAAVFIIIIQKKKRH